MAMEAPSQGNVSWDMKFHLTLKLFANYRWFTSNIYNDKLLKQQPRHMLIVTLLQFMSLQKCSNMLSRKITRLFKMVFTPSLMVFLSNMITSSRPIYMRLHLTSYGNKRPNFVWPPLGVVSHSLQRYCCHPLVMQYCSSDRCSGIIRISISASNDLIQCRLPMS